MLENYENLYKKIQLCFPHIAGTDTLIKLFGFEKSVILWAAPVMCKSVAYDVRYADPSQANPSDPDAYKTTPNYNSNLNPTATTAQQMPDPFPNHDYFCDCLGTGCLALTHSVCHPFNLLLGLANQAHANSSLCDQAVADIRQAKALALEKGENAGKDLNLEQQGSIVLAVLVVSWANTVQPVDMPNFEFWKSFGLYQPLEEIYNEYLPKGFVLDQKILEAMVSRSKQDVFSVTTFIGARDLPGTFGPDGVPANYKLLDGVILVFNGINEMLPIEWIPFFGALINNRLFRNASKKNPIERDTDNNIISHEYWIYKKPNALGWVQDYAPIKFKYVPKSVDTI